MNFIDLGAPRGSSERMPTWFKIEASNNDENWTLLLERASITRWRDGKTRQYSAFVLDLRDMIVVISDAKRQRKSQV